MKIFGAKLAMCIILTMLVSVSCSGGAQPAAPAVQAVSTVESKPPAATVPPKSQPPAAQPAAATPVAVRKDIDVSKSNQPGFSISGGIVETITVGQGYDKSVDKLDPIGFVLPVKGTQLEKLGTVYLGYGINSKSRELAFTETLTINGQVIPLQGQGGQYELVDAFKSPPSGDGKKQLRVKGLGVKPGAQFPLGQYEVEVFLNGRLEQKGVFHINQPKSVSRLFPGGEQLLSTALGLGWLRGFSLGNGAKIDPSIFVVVEDDVEVISEDALYYDMTDYDQALDAASQEEQLYQSFPPDIQEAIRQDSLMDTPQETCAEMGGTFDSGTGTCEIEEFAPTEAPTDHPVEATPEPVQEPEAPSAP